MLVSEASAHKPPFSITYVPLQSFLTEDSLQLTTSSSHLAYVGVHMV